MLQTTLCRSRNQRLWTHVTLAERRVLAKRFAEPPTSMPANFDRSVPSLSGAQIASRWLCVGRDDAPAAGVRWLWQRELRQRPLRQDVPYPARGAHQQPRSRQKLPSATHC